MCATANATHLERNPTSHPDGDNKGRNATSNEVNASDLRIIHTDAVDQPRWESIAARGKSLFGLVPTTLRVMTIGSNAAESYLGMCELNQRSSLSPLEREYVAIQTALRNECRYCLAGHLVQALVAGAEPDDLNKILGGRQLSDRRSQAVVRVTDEVLERRGAVDDSTLSAVKAVGLDDRALVDIVTVVAENTLGNLINNLAQTPPEKRLTRILSRRAIHGYAIAGCD